MAIVIGTSAGFVLTSPSADPAGPSDQLGGTGRFGAQRDVAPVTGEITEIGIWIDGGTDLETFTVGLYTHDEANNKPDVLLGSVTSATAVAGAWLKTTVSIPITEGEIYWIALVTASTDVTGNTEGSTSYYSMSRDQIHTLVTPWNNIGGRSDGTMAVYALYSGTQVQSQFILATNFGFSLPTNAQVTNIKARIKVDTLDPQLTVRANDIRLYYGSAFVGTNIAQNTAITSEGNIYFEGEPNNIWGYNVTVSIANNSGFGFGLSVGFSNDTPQVTFSISEMELIIYYISDVTSDFVATADVLLGDKASGLIYETGRSFFQDNGTNIRTVRRTGQITHGTLHSKQSNKLALRVKRGVGTIDEPSPNFLVRWRDNYGGWSSDKYISLGGQTDTYTVSNLFRLGTYKTRQYEIIHDDPTDFIFVEGDEDVEVLED